MRVFARSRLITRSILLLSLFAYLFSGPAPGLLVLAGTVPPVRQAADQSPLALVQSLIETIYGPDEAQAQSAMVELLRLAGLPVASIYGPVVALPEGLVLEDALIYAELIPDLTRAVRKGDFYTPSQVADLLVEIELSSEPLPPEVLVAGLGQWGKGTDVPLESQIAGAAVRALAGRRLEVLYLGADSDQIEIDPLQTVLILAHATSRVRARLPEQDYLPGAGWFGVVPVSARQAGPCDALEKKLTGRTEAQQFVAQQVRDRLIDSWKEMLFNKKVNDSIDKGKDVYSKGTAVLSMLLLLLGAQIDVNDNKGGLTHFKHDKGSRAEHIVVRALATFDSNIAKQKVACYSLAGITVPPPGPLDGFKVRWSMDQAAGSDGGGSYLRVVSSDRKKLDSCGTCGETTGPDGRSTIELYPPVELKQEGSEERGKERTGWVQVKASLDKEDFPFKVSELIGLVKPGGYAADKTFDLAISALTRAGLPSSQRLLRVDYHGSEVLVAKGKGNLFLFYAMAPVELDIYTCDGLAGKWQGRGGLGGADVNVLGSIAESITGQTIPRNVVYMRDLSFFINPDAHESVFTIVPEAKMTGVMRVDDSKARRIWQEMKNYATGQKNLRPVGQVEVLINETSMSIITIGGSTVHPVYAVNSDPRCPGGGYEFENIP
jgi:hypothetical protein